MNRYPAWKYLLVVFVVIFGMIYAAPNLFLDDPSLQIAGGRTVTVNDGTLKTVETTLKSNKIEYKSAVFDDKGILIRFADEDVRGKARDAIKKALDPNYVVALNFARTTPTILRNLGAEPMYMGLDLRGGLHFLIEIEMDTAFKQQLERYKNDIFDVFKANKKRKLRARSMLIKNNTIEMKYKTADKRDEVLSVLRSKFLSDLKFSVFERGDAFYIRAEITTQKIEEHRSNTITQIINVLKKRIDDKYQGLMEPVIVRQGDSRIVAEFPGVQDSKEIIDVMTAAASLEFRMEHTGYSIADARAGKALGASIYKERDSGREVLLKNKLIITGQDITHATATSDQNGQPAVSVTLNATGASIMKDNTRENLGKRMGVVFIETIKEIKQINGDNVPVKRELKEVISLATIQGLFSKRFEITGLSRAESTQLALLLRAGALAAPIEIVEERTVGPSMGKENISKGINSVLIGFIIVVVFMLIWYKGFGLLANVALIVNLVLIVAVLSLFQATLTLPGIAGIVLTVGMAVDANVLIYERIREELSIGNTPQASINSGYEKAFSTILDANVTTLIAAIVLFVFGTGPIKGFATTLSIGIATSMFTSIVGTRAIINLLVGSRKLSKLSI
ncbi:Protein translocase subunit SecD [hydrothermal vent metagenome]|uniref:Protein translocase subunit SecD n=1 Tax=hydrothermal vent metagenome TaxID=652676 RepID=A0A3B0ZM00_9ZZZZ